MATKEPSSPPLRHDDVRAWPWRCPAVPRRAPLERHEEPRARAHTRAPDQGERESARARAYANSPRGRITTLRVVVVGVCAHHMRACLSHARSLIAHASLACVDARTLCYTSCSSTHAPPIAHAHTPTQPPRAMRVAHTPSFRAPRMGSLGQHCLHSNHPPANDSQLFFTAQHHYLSWS